MIYRSQRFLLALLLILSALAQIPAARAQTPSSTPAPSTPAPDASATPLAPPSIPTATLATDIPISFSTQLITGTTSLTEVVGIESEPEATLSEEPPTAEVTGENTGEATAETPAPPTETATPVAEPTIAPTITATEEITTSVTLTSTPAITGTPASTSTLSAEALAAAMADQALDDRVDALFNRMTVADRVGQLFVVTFNGNDTSFESEITELIYGYRIGGVVISPDNGNFSNGAGTDTPRSVAVLANQLQAIAYGILLPADQALQPVPNQPWPPGNLVSLEREIGVTPPNIPLFIGVQQAGDNLPGTSLRRGFTPLPSQLAIGSTWSPETSLGIGSIVGRELSAVGINLLLGPSLNLVDQPRADVVGSLGAFSFGGNPYWVGRTARAYISGIHQGSQQRVATMAGNFPGQGDVDRLPDEEVATIQRTATELQQITLPPFLAVTRSSRGPGVDPAVTDGMMTSHMRFSALQAADGRSTPLSLDPELTPLVNQQVGDWRERGGVLMSGPLGVPAIRRYFDPALNDFPARRVALDAFTAGHDLLYLTRFALDENWESQLDNYRATVAFFQERYRSDLAFAAQVDASVKRILKLKLRLYGESGPTLQGSHLLPVPLSEVLVQESDLDVLPAASPDIDPVPVQSAREALTVLYPNPATDALPAAPQAGESIVIVTDSRLQRECATCTAEAAIDPDAIARIILSLYGPDATGQISRESLTSITFSDLSQILAADEAAAAAAASATPSTGGVSSTLSLPTATPRPESAESNTGTTLGSGLAQYQDAIADADWLIFAMLDVNTLYPSSDALRRFLRQRPEEVEEKRVVVFALNAPWFLDATEISKLNAYYGVYSKTEPYLETAVRALFRAFTPDGAPSVSAPSTRFASLSARLVPNPQRPLPLVISTGTIPSAGIVATTSPTSTYTVVTSNLDTVGSDEVDTGPAVVNAGSTIHVEIGPILDLNGNTVPDGTVVELSASFEGAELALTVEPALTRSGRAVRDLVLERGGVLRIVATSGAASSGDALIVNVIEAPPVSESVTSVVTGGQVITPLQEISGSADTPTSTLPLTTTVTPGQSPWRITDGSRVNTMSLLFSLVTMLIVLSVVYLAQMHVVGRDMLFTAMVWSVIAGLAAYVAFATGWLPGGDFLAQSLNFLAAPAVVLVAILVPLIVLQLRTARQREG